VAMVLILAVVVLVELVPLHIVLGVLQREQDSCLAVFIILQAVVVVQEMLATVQGVSVVVVLAEVVEPLV